MRDPYHLAVALTWPQFLATLLAIYVLVNVVFATLFWLIPGSVANAQPHNFGDAFFFSIETLETVGYGEMSPGTLYGRVIERTHLPAFPLTWTLMHVLDEQSPLHGCDTARAIAARAQLFVTIEARDPTLAALVHEIRNYALEDVRFGMRYAEAVTIAEDGTPVADLTQIGALEPDVGDYLEPGWTEREEPLG